MSESQSFSNVPAELVSALQDRNFKELTTIQTAVLETTEAGRDLRMASTTGSGKTVAVGMVIARDIPEWDLPKTDKKKVSRPKVLMVAPTRELAHQLEKELKWLYRDLKLRLAVVTGGNSIMGDFKALQKSPHILVGTPGRLVDHIKRGTVDLGSLDVAVLDEADEMLDMGFRDDLQFILDGTPEGRQTHLVSATFPRGVLSLAKRYQKDAQLVEGAPEGTPNQDIDHCAMLVNEKDRVSALINMALLAGESRMLVFVQTRIGAAKTAMQLQSSGFAAAALHGDMGQRERTQTLEAFRRGQVTILAATDVAARGLDIDDISQVVHFDLPDNDSVYTHRSGRTGRAGKKGRSTLLVTPHYERRVQQVGRRLGVDLSWLKVPSIQQIQESSEKRLLKEISDLESAPSRELKLAERLLEDLDPKTLVAYLLSRSDYHGACQPKEISAPAKKKNASKSPFDRDKSKRDRGERGFGKGKGKSSRDSLDFTRFHVSWGANHGANASRLVAMMCRRGGIRGKEIGAIKVTDFSSTVDVASKVAPNFAKAAGKPDPRNPKVRIRPWSKN